MNTLAMTEAKADQMSAIEDTSMEIITQALSDQIDADSDKVKIAVKMMSAVAKNRQTMMHRAAVDFRMALSIASESELKKYLKATNPQIQKALGGKK